MRMTVRPCMKCGADFTVNNTSIRRYCEDCLPSVILRHSRQIINRKGITYDKWRKGIVKAVNRFI